MKRVAPRGAAALALAVGIVAAAWAAVTYSAVYTLSGGTATQTNQTYSTSAADQSGVWVSNGGSLTLVNPTITTTGNSSSVDNSSQYGLNAALLASSAGAATVNGGSVTTSGAGANGLFATGSGSVAPGLVFSGAYPTTSRPAVTIGGTAAEVSFCGLVGAGLYQINVTVPGSLSAGTYPVVVTQSGVSSPSTGLLKIN